MILSSYYKGIKNACFKYQYDIVTSTKDYEWFETFLNNPYKLLSFDYDENSKQGINKGIVNVTSIEKWNTDINKAHGIVYCKYDLCLFLFNPDFKHLGINTFEIFIARDMRVESYNLIDKFYKSELDPEMKILKEKAKTNEYVRIC